MKANTTEQTVFYYLTESDNEWRIRFCEAFYQAFSKLPGRVLLDQIWHINDATQQIDFRIPRQETQIMLWLHQDVVLGAACGCTDGEQSFSQVKQYGFQNPRPDLKTFEVLSIFRNREMALSMRIVPDFLEKSCFPYLREHHFENMMATCSEPMWPVYQRWGWDLLQVNTISGFKRYFISKRL
ncbi:MAG: hypothetical protein EP332_07585 [Bacteroidetes bacterium]|nr:MAG: hypothetical protein EP332_07585 [Bacteroidota bacterium]